MACPQDAGQELELSCVLGLSGAGTQDPGLVQLKVSQDPGLVRRIWGWYS
jgi:hypothetical protein